MTPVDHCSAGATRAHSYSVRRICVSLYFFFLMIRRPPRSTLFPYNDALPIFPDNIPHELLAKAKCVVVLPSVVKAAFIDRKSTRLNSSHLAISYAVFCLK